MVDVGKREDRMLDLISEHGHRRDQTKAALEFYTQAHMIPTEVSDHLWQILSGVVKFEQEESNEPVSAGSA